MGRPLIGKVAMTGAERVRRYRQKHGTDKRVTKPATKRGTDHAAGPLEARIRDLQAALAHERHEHMATRNMYHRLLNAHAGILTEYRNILALIRPRGSQQRARRKHSDFELPPRGWGRIVSNACS